MLVLTVSSAQTNWRRGSQEHEAVRKNVPHGSPFSRGGRRLQNRPDLTVLILGLLHLPRARTWLLSLASVCVSGHFQGLHEGP